MRGSQQVSSSGTASSAATQNLSDSDFAFLRALIYEHSRIALNENKRELVYSRITKRLRATGIADATGYCTFLRTAAGAQELPRLIDAISTNHTHFFRETEHFTFVRDEILPAWSEGRSASSTPFRAWSAACSSGEEVYTLAMTLDDGLLKTAAAGRWSILATDISHRILEKARLAKYPQSALEKVPDPWMRRYFLRESASQPDMWTVRPEIRAKLLFHQLNLLGPQIPRESVFDLIFCRNVMIYFDKPTQEELIQRLYAALKPGAYLMVGHSESLSGIHHQMRVVRPAIYQRMP